MADEQVIRRKVVWAALIGGCIALAAVVSLALVRPWRSESPPAADPGPGNAMLASRFATLSRANTNQCGLTGETVMTMPDGNRLRGSCCTSMDFARYADQVRGLRAYAGVAAVPTDPYDIPVTLAKTLLSYDRDINLTPVQQQTYDDAVKASNELGPCCCHCWRWTVFEGQAKFLLTEMHFTPRQIAAVWNLEDGCGGPAESTAPS